MSRFCAVLAQFAAARREFAARVPVEAWRYLDSEQWQAGGARYVEIELDVICPRDDVRAAVSGLARHSLMQLAHADCKAHERQWVHGFDKGELMRLEV